MMRAKLPVLCYTRRTSLNWEGQNKYYLKETVAKRVRVESQFKVTFQTSHISKTPNSL